MDLETGEEMLQRNRDEETGESPATPQLNEETGEEEINCTQPQPVNKKPFKIPNNFKKPATEHLEISSERIAQNILTREPISNRMSPIILFLLPTVFVVPIVAVMLGMAELFLHIWAHKKNKSLKNKDIYYKSPLHVIASEFCANCVDERTKKKIRKMQDKRNNKFTKYGIEYFRRIVT